ncbi:hypothetical protein ESB00_05910 [Oleiharenicola lentus]|uniref:Lipoprotein n=1 Tax=Oleiharenicola lentus TaxID=2508720 RepID=A0A4Q1C8X5_9BACT|nr:hypothetical protein [Oleiharenicola lentus]RXK55433.1 hypothetical protein ESB00_05910 [Oleiharenicola lentus]
MRVLSAFLLLLVTAFTAGCATSTPQSRIDANRGAFSEYPSDVRRNIREGRVEVGYTAEMAEMALGKPGRKLSRRDETNEESEVWVYYRNRPRLSIGLAIGSGGYRSTSTGISMSSTPDADMETMRLILRDGHVVAVETVTR